MLRKILKSKKAQNTAEYAILISLVVAGIIAMQTYAQRALQAKVRDAGQYLGEAGDDELDGTVQYEPYYLSTNYTVARNEETIEKQDNETVSREVNGIRAREEEGFQRSTYNGISGY